MPSLLDFVFNKRKPIPGEWEYDIHPYFGPDTEYAPYESAPPENMPPLYQGEQGGLMDDWIPYEPTPSEEPYEYPGVEFVTRGPYDEEAGKYTSETPLGEWEIPGFSTSPTEPGIGAASQKAPDSFWLDKSHPEGGYWLEGGTSYWMTYPGGGYWSGTNDIPDKAMEYYKSLEIDPGEPSFEPPPNNDGLMGIVGGGIIDPGPIYSESVPPESAPPESAPPDFYSGIPYYAGPVYSEEEYAAYLDSLPPTTEPAPLSIAYDSYSGSPYTY